jgi:hypothetical protein
MDPPEFSLMLEHYFQVELSNEQRARLKNAIDPRKGKPHLNLTPAQVEQLTAEHEEIDDMLTALEKKGMPPLPPHAKIGGSPRAMSGSITRTTRSVSYDGV